MYKTISDYQKATVLIHMDAIFFSPSVKEVSISASLCEEVCMVSNI